MSWTILLLTSLAVALYFPLQYTQGSLESLIPRNVGLASTYAHRPLAVQVAFYAHITFAGIALLVGPFQFSATIRQRTSASITPSAASTSSRSWSAERPRSSCRSSAR